MAITKQTIEHEFLFRWDEQGNPQGCHIAYREAILEDGAEISSRFLDPRPVQLSDAEKLAEIGAAIDAAALALNTSQAATIATMTQDASDAATAHAAALAAKDSALAALTEQLAAAQATIAELQPPEVNGVPQEVTMRQAQLALLGAGLLDNIEAAISAIPDATARRAAEITWTKSSMVKRSNPLIAQLSSGLGLNDAAIDALFVAAAAL